jgi:hypothetical protein
MEGLYKEALATKEELGVVVNQLKGHLKYLDQIEVTAAAGDLADIAAERAFVKADLDSIEEQYNDAVGILTKAND